MNQKYISVEDFLNKSNIKMATLLKRYKQHKEIPGITLENGNFKIISGSRYPFNLGTNKLRTTDDKRYVLLKAINEDKYIDYKMLKTEQDEFENILVELLNVKLIEKNKSNNIYGANEYRITITGSNYMTLKKRETIRFINELIAEHIGQITEGVTSALLRKVKL